MNGFVSLYRRKCSVNPDIRKLVMCYFRAAQVPMNDFFCEEFLQYATDGFSPVFARRDPEPTV